jgi:type I restriction enzyme S subunit
VFFGGKQIFELDPSNKKYLSLTKHSKRIKAELEITENTVLITRSGTIGKVALTPKHWEHWIASDHIIRVIPATNELAGYMFIFLSSAYGCHLIKRYTYGSVVDEIDDNHVSRIPFPLLKNKSIQTKINELALDANEKSYEAYKTEQQAMQIFNDEVI